MENFLYDLLPALRRHGVDAAAIVHDGSALRRKGACVETPSTVFFVPSYGNLLYAPVSPSFPLTLHRVICDMEPAILHLHMPNTSALWALANSRAKRIPWVVHWHSDVVASEIDPRMAYAYKLYRPLEQKILAQASAVIATSAPYLSSSRALYRWMGKCCVIPLGIDVKRFRILDGPLKKWAFGIFPKHKTSVLAVGRLTYYKGFDDLIRAAARVPEIHVILVGEGSGKTRLQSLISALELAERVKILGFMEEKRLHALMAASDCLCVSSVERTEAFGLVLLEAMCYGKPVVASDIPGSGIGVVVEHNKTGFLFPPGDVEQLSRMLKIMAGSPEKRKKMGKAGELRLNDHFLIEQVAQEVFSIYKTILSVR